MSHHFEKLDEAALAKLRTLETKIGNCVVAVKKQNKLADISAEQLEALQSSENELGVILLAYACPVQ